MRFDEIVSSFDLDSLDPAGNLTRIFHQVYGSQVIPVSLLQQYICRRLLRYTPSAVLDILSNMPVESSVESLVVNDIYTTSLRESAKPVSFRNGVEVLADKACE